MDELYERTARDVVNLLARREIAPIDAVEAALARIEAVDGRVNAIPTVCAERARERAKALLYPEYPGPGYLWGLPVAIKDLTDVKGVRTTYGSPIFADHVPERNDIVVETLERNGAIVIGKSNTPEFGAGSHTFNEVFGVTRNPWNAAKSAGGSSGGAAAALACGEVWLATGSDLGGSLRNPASFCSVVGLRPSPGRVAHGPGVLPFGDLPVDGPMARNVGDLALMLDAMSGHDPHDPLSLPAPAVPWQTALERPLAPARVAFSPDLGLAPVDPEIAAICRQAAEDFTALGAVVDEACPAFHDADRIFHVLRAHQFAAGKQELLAHRTQLKPEIVWNIEAGLALQAGEIAEAERMRGALYAQVSAFFDTYDLLVCPAAIVPPFDVGIRYPTEVAGVTFESYIDWLVICSAVTLTGCPALSIPCGFTKGGLPVGLQMVGRPRGEAELLAAASLFEAAHDFARLVPMEPRDAAA